MYSLVINRIEQLSSRGTVPSEMGRGHAQKQEQKAVQWRISAPRGGRPTTNETIKKVPKTRALVSAAYLERRSERRSPALSAELSASSFEIMSAKMSASLFFNDR